jgi:transcriptional regulator with XRE-family HTH domain
MKMVNPSILEPEVPTKDDVRELRERAGLTQKELARRTAMPLERLKKYEQGKYSMDAPTWLLTRITCDALIRARWAQAIARSG